MNIFISILYRLSRLIIFICILHRGTYIGASGTYWLSIFVPYNGLKACLYLFYRDRAYEEIKSSDDLRSPVFSMPQTSSRCSHVALSPYQSLQFLQTYSEQSKNNMCEMQRHCCWSDQRILVLMMITGYILLLTS